MFKTHVGPVEDEAAVAYLRPETAQGMFVNFANVCRPRRGEAALRHRPDRQVLPQRDHARELRVPHPRVRADGDGVLRAARRQSSAGSSTGCEERFAWYTRLRHRPGQAAPRATTRPSELSHYSAGTADVEFLFPWGWDELEGIANRTDFDLTAHAASTRASALEYFDQATNERYIPHVIEPAAGATRTMMAFLLSAYDEDEVGGEARSRAPPPPPARALPGGGAAAVEEGHP